MARNRWPFLLYQVTCWWGCGGEDNAGHRRLLCFAGGLL